jgi:phosphatidate cytidylyltransferase
VSIDHAKRVIEQGRARWRSLRQRTQSTLLMLAAASSIIVGGHAYAMMLCFAVQFAMAKELFAFVSNAHAEENAPGEDTAALRRTTTTLRWYWFWTLSFAVYGRFAKYLYLGFMSAKEWNELLQNGAEVSPGAWLAMHHTFLSYCAYLVGLVYFVLTLRKGRYAYQFAQFAWTHMIVAATTMTGYFNVSNLLEGMIWFVFPLFLVIVNDIMAYVFGKIFGKTPLIKISPNKTWEGFLGAFVSTLVAALAMASYLQKFSYFTCPPSGDMYFRGIFSRSAKLCAPNEPFIVSDKPITMFLGTVVGPLATKLTGIATVRCSMFMVHSLALGTFASAVAPFGGFFASGFKRAFKIKDFAATIPGHGGITDRMDCQVINSCFSSLYLSNFITHVGGSLTLGALLTKIELASDAHIVALYKALTKMIEARGLSVGIDPSIQTIVQT